METMARWANATSFQSASALNDTPRRQPTEIAWCPPLLRASNYPRAATAFSLALFVNAFLSLAACIYLYQNPLPAGPVGCWSMVFEVCILLIGAPCIMILGRCLNVTAYHAYLNVIAASAVSSCAFMLEVLVARRLPQPWVMKVLLAKQLFILIGNARMFIAAAQLPSRPMLPLFDPFHRHIFHIPIPPYSQATVNGSPLAAHHQSSYPSALTPITPHVSFTRSEKEGSQLISGDPVLGPSTTITINLEAGSNTESVVTLEFPRGANTQEPFTLYLQVRPNLMITIVHPGMRNCICGRCGPERPPRLEIHVSTETVRSSV
ncbi:hypothetical protein DL93DRAFT_2229180 [Clavulina sp. PMI_390]|nr:hypothetical protein DL93DRAFT_2229180 [Clavulina sp. PMI_390]